jgi:hypothetical protein
VLTFGGPAVVGGSLPDGVYDLRVVAAQVRGVASPGAAMAADFAFAFHRLYSDADGDGDSDNADLFQFRGSYNKPNTDPAFRWYFDYENDGDVDNADLFQVRNRRAVTFKGY